MSRRRGPPPGLALAVVAVVAAIVAAAPAAPAAGRTVLRYHPRGGLVATGAAPRRSSSRPAPATGSSLPGPAAQDASTPSAGSTAATASTPGTGVSAASGPAPADPAAGGASGLDDPLAANGLSSPECATGAGVALSPAESDDCQASGTVAAPDPIEDYDFAVHIDTSALSVENDAEAAFQDMVLRPVWNAVVWITQALIVALEWCYSLDLLNHATLGTVGRALQSASSAFTDPWLAAVLAVAGVLAAYHGLVRRRVAASVGDALVILAMIAGGLWLIDDPAGTIGQASVLVDQASIGTLAAVSSGDPGAPDRSFGASLQGVFAAMVSGPWCYMEFGDVSWCEDPGQLDPS